MKIGVRTPSLSKSIKAKKYTFEFRALKQHYQSQMVPRDSNVQAFELRHKNHDYSLLLERVGDVLPGNKKIRLTFVERGTQNVLPLNTDTSFKIDISKDLRNKLFRFFHIESGDGHDNFFKVLSTIDSHCHAIFISNVPRSTIASTYQVEKKDLLYFDYFIDWKTANAKKPNTKDRHVSFANREKTQVLIPDLYALIKNLDISVAYTDIQPTDEHTKYTAEFNHL
ncbi:DUF6037 family protein [Furfurilactobacillus entadae]|uniref:DUF6037 family protein n=1 Tax=Furfurilactobacillus entadae TaxID=2922307 RepID=UPI0035EC17AC